MTTLQQVLSLYARRGFTVTIAFASALALIACSVSSERDDASVGTQASAIAAVADLACVDEEGTPGTCTNDGTGQCATTTTDSSESAAAVTDVALASQSLRLLAGDAGTSPTCPKKSCTTTTTTTKTCPGPGACTYMVKRCTGVNTACTGGGAQRGTCVRGATTHIWSCQPSGSTPNDCKIPGK